MNVEVSSLLVNSEYLNVFLDESGEHLQAINDNLLKLEQSPEDLAIVGEVFRSAHTLKGMAATMGFEDLAHLTHNMENVLDLIRQQQLPVTSEVIDVIFTAIEDLETIVANIGGSGDGKHDVSSCVALLERLEKGGGTVHTNRGSREVAATVEEVEKAHWHEFEFDEFERTVLVQSFEQGYKAYQIKVILDQQTMLKAARVFMVFEILEQIGEIIKSTPSTEYLEEEKFDSEFVVTVVTKVGQTEVKGRVLKVSEIREVDIHEITEDALAEKVAKKKAPHPHKKKRMTRKRKAMAPKKSQGADVNKTIRVNIERLDMLMNLFEELVIDRGRLEQIASELKK